MLLNYDTALWEEIPSIPRNTLQLFITNECNMRCRGCFYKHKLVLHGTDSDRMGFDDYKAYVDTYSPTVGKIILLGGEPTLHPDLSRMIEYNRNSGLPTTIYTNGSNLKAQENTNLTGVEIRVGVYGFEKSEKPLMKIPRTNLPITVVYMLRKNNVCELEETSRMAEDYNCHKFYISSIRDIAQTRDFWKDTEQTVSPYEYAGIIQKFVDNYKGNMSELHLARRGVLETGLTPSEVKTCRFGNVFPDGEKIICPFDISNRITVPELKFNSVPCNKRGCLLQKIVLRRKKMRE